MSLYPNCRLNDAPCPCNDYWGETGVSIIIKSIIIKVDKSKEFRRKLAEAIVMDALLENVDREIFLYTDPWVGEIYTLKEDESGWVLYPDVWWRVRTVSSFFMGVNFDFDSLLDIYSREQLIQMIADELIADIYEIDVSLLPPKQLAKAIVEAIS